MRFECLPGCGLCCSYKVLLLPGEVETIGSLGYHPGFFSQGGCLAKDNGFCVFLGDDKRCSIYDRRPVFCRSYPFYHEDDSSIDVDLSCPGVGRGPEVEPVFEYPAQGAPDPKTVRKLPGYVPFERFREIGLDWCDDNARIGGLAILLKSAQDQARRFNPMPVKDFGDLFDIPDGMNTHLAEEGITTYPFDLQEERLVIGDHTYALTDEEMPEEHLAEVMQYLRIWFHRRAFYRFCLACSINAPVLRRPMQVGFHFVESLAQRIAEIRAALTHRWKQDDIEIVKEAIRAVDGRLRTKCCAAKIQIIQGKR